MLAGAAAKRRRKVRRTARRAAGRSRCCCWPSCLQRWLAAAARRRGSSACSAPQREEAPVADGPVARPPVFVELPDITAPGSRRAGGRCSSVSRRGWRCLGPQDAAVVTASMPRILDLFQTYLREMRPEELRGSAGTQRLRESWWRAPTLPPRRPASPMCCSRRSSCNERRRGRRGSGRCLGRGAAGEGGPPMARASVEPGRDRQLARLRFGQDGSAEIRHRADHLLRPCRL